jgi:tripartite-type tricarboxylate transporter receptor subunit TctC
MALAEEPAAGHTRLMITSVVAVGRTLYPGSAWPAHPLDVFAPVSDMIKLTNVVVVPASSPFKTMQDLVVAGQGGAGPVQYGVPSLGSSVHLGMEMLAERGGFKVAGIGFKGGPDLINNVIGGHIGVAADNLTNSLAHIRSGRVRALMVMSPTRNAVIPQVPCSADAGFGDFESVSWQGVAVKAGTPRPLVERLARELALIAAMPGVRKMFEEQGDFIVASTPDAFASLIRQETATMTAVLKRLNITRS